MIGFEYHGYSTENIIGTPLILANTGEIDGLGSTRTKNESERTLSKVITNEYGTIYEPLSFNYCLIREDLQPFTDEEQRIVERWLTSYKLSSEIKFTNRDDYQYTYYGLFTTTDWQRANGNYAVCNFTCEINGVYPYRYFKHEFESSESPYILNCESDELDEYVYPKVSVQADRFESLNMQINIQSVTDRNNIFKMKLPTDKKIIADCLNCMVYYEDNSKLTYKDLGWNNVDYIYWLRLLPGENELQISGTSSGITIEYYAPYKRIGGWLV